MFAPDPRTLSLAIGLANLAFAALASLYLINARTSHRALETWRWGRLAAGSGFLVNLASSTTLLPVPLVLGNILQTAGAGLDLAAYCMLLDRERWQRPVGALVVFSVASLVLAAHWMESQASRLLVFSALGVIYYSIMAALMLGTARKDWLQRVIGLTDSLMAMVMLLRIVKGLAVAPLVRFDSDAITLLLYVTMFLTAIINGFGFLLVARRKDERFIYRALDELEQRSDDESRWRNLLALASHEFRTPAAQIKMSLDSLRIQADGIPPEIARRLENIDAAAQRLTRLSNTLLTQERLDDPALVARESNLDLSVLLRESLDAYRAGARIELDLPALPVRVGGDPTQLRIAVQNLVDNALEHGGQDGGPIRVFLRQTSQSIEIGVADAGPGIADEHKPHVFDRFRSQRGGFARGLGLSIVATIARNHGGDALVRDNVPRGTVISIRLPASPAT